MTQRKWSLIPLLAATFCGTPMLSHAAPSDADIEAARQECLWHVYQMQAALLCNDDASPQECAWAAAYFKPGWEDCAKLPPPKPDPEWVKLHDLVVRENQEQPRGALDKYLAEVPK